MYCWTLQRGGGRGHGRGTRARTWRERGTDTSKPQTSPKTCDEVHRAHKGCGGLRRRREARTDRTGVSRRAAQPPHGGAQRLSWAPWRGGRRRMKSSARSASGSPCCASATRCTPRPPGTKRPSATARWRRSCTSRRWTPMPSVRRMVPRMLARASAGVRAPMLRQSMSARTPAAKRSRLSTSPEASARGPERQRPRRGPAGRSQARAQPAQGRPRGRGDAARSAAAHHGACGRGASRRRGTRDPPH